MKMMIYRGGGVFGEQAFQLRECRLSDGGEGFELPQQLLLPLCPDAGNAVQLGIPQTLAPELAVVGDGEAVGLLLNLADEGENRLIVVNADLLPLRGHQRPGAVPVVLHHAEHREGQVQLLKRSHGHLRVSHAAVDEQQVGGFVKALVPRLVVDKPPGHDLTHGGVVVLIGQPLHLEALVVAFLRLSLLKYHHAGNDVRAGNVGNIEGFHPFRGGNGQHFSKKRQRRADPLFPAGDTLSFLKGIFAGQLHQTQIVAPLGDVELRPPPVLLFQQLGEQLAVVDLKGQQNPLRGDAAAEIELLEQAGNGFQLVVGSGKHFVVLVQQIAAGKMQHGKARLGLGLPVTDHVGVRESTGRYKLLLPQVFHRVQPVAEAGRQLKFQIVRGGEHLSPQLFGHRLVISLQ